MLVTQHSGRVSLSSKAGWISRDPASKTGIGWGRNSIYNNIEENKILKYKLTEAIRLTQN